MQGGQSEQRTHNEGTKKVGATRLRGAAGRKRGAGGLDEDETKIKDSVLGDTAESPPQEHSRSSHAVFGWLWK